MHHIIIFNYLSLMYLNIFLNFCFYKLIKLIYPIRILSFFSKFNPIIFNFYLILVFHYLFYTNS